MTAIYHITHCDNIPEIVAHGELVSDTRRRALALAPRSIAHAHIKDYRAKTRMPVGPGGVIADYVPFYFCPRSPMLYVNWKGGAGDDGQRRIVHLVAEAEAIAGSGRAYCIADAHAVTQPTGFYDNLAGLAKLNWDYVRAPWWNDTVEHPDRKRRKQAEFLVHDALPWTMIERIGVIDAGTAVEVELALRGAGHRPVVEVHRDWYYP